MEELAIGKETDAASLERLERLRRDLADNGEDMRALTRPWRREHVPQPRR
ncbi:hypothetical protein H4N49_18515 [Streptomyces sp. DHE17-7]|nr:hypothetical protein [Streptomyces sp. DHE17-7]MBJ6620619.1 hypothetical protein [Streptomyces sp. DHE17-7]